MFTTDTCRGGCLSGRAVPREPGMRPTLSPCSAACCSCKARPGWFSVPLWRDRRGSARRQGRLLAFGAPDGCGCADGAGALCHRNRRAHPDHRPASRSCVPLARPTRLSTAQGTLLLGFARLLAFARPSGPTALPPAQLLAIPPGGEPGPRTPEFVPPPSLCLGTECKRASGVRKVFSLCTSALLSDWIQRAGVSATNWWGGQRQSAADESNDA